MRIEIMVAFVRLLYFCVDRLFVCWLVNGITDFFFLSLVVTLWKYIFEFFLKFYCLAISRKNFFFLTRSVNLSRHKWHWLALIMLTDMSTVLQRLEGLNNDDIPITLWRYYSHHTFNKQKTYNNEHITNQKLIILIISNTNKQQSIAICTHGPINQITALNKS